MQQLSLNNKSIKPKINVLEVFKELEDEVYAILKKSEMFPDYVPGMDIDILCLEPDVIARKILKSLHKSIAKGTKVLVTALEEKNQVYIDIYPSKLSNHIELRFDLIGQLPSYTKVEVKESLQFSILFHREPFVLKLKDDMQVSVLVPSLIDDMVVRYLEYIEYYDLRPDKVKHLDYILSKLESDKAARGFLDKLHMYTKLKLLDQPRDSYLGRQGYLRLRDNLMSLNERIDQVSSDIARQNNSQALSALQAEIQSLREELASTKANTEQLLHADVIKLGRVVLNPYRLWQRIKGKLTLRKLKRK